MVEVALSGHQTEVVVGKEDGLKHNKKYLIKVTTMNVVGSVISHGNGRNIIGGYMHSQCILN